MERIFEIDLRSLVKIFAVKKEICLLSRPVDLFVRCGSFSSRVVRGELGEGNGLFGDCCEVKISGDVIEVLVLVDL